MSKTLKTVEIGGTTYILRHVAQPRVNGGKCNQYEVRKVLPSGDYHQQTDIYCPLGRSAEDHLRGVFRRRRELDNYAA